MLAFLLILHYAFSCLVRRADSNRKGYHPHLLHQLLWQLPTFRLLSPAFWQVFSLSLCPQFSADICCGQMAGWIKIQPFGTAPKFSADICCCQIAGWIKMPLSREVGLGPSDTVLDGDPALPPQKGQSPQFSVHVCCGQMVAHLSYCWALVAYSHQDWPLWKQTPLSLSLSAEFFTRHFVGIVGSGRMDPATVFSRTEFPVIALSTACFSDSQSMWFMHCWEEYLCIVIYQLAVGECDSSLHCTYVHSQP